MPGGVRQDARMARFLSKDELANASGIRRDHIGRLERGCEGESRPPTVRKLAAALDVDPHELLADEV